MKDLILIVITAVIVSLDSFVAGFSLSLNKKADPTLPSAVALMTLLLCLATTFIGNFLSRYIQGYVNYFGAALLITLALVNVLKKENEQCRLGSVMLGESITIGIAVGMDAAVANLSLTLNGVGLIAPIIFALMHYFTVWIGQKLAQKITLSHTNVFSAVILVVLAVMKLI